MFDFDVPERLLSIVARHDRNDILVKLTGIVLSPEFQDNHLRITTLIQLAIAKARGRKRATSRDLAAMLNLLKLHTSGRNEDPSEDVFVTSVTLPTDGNLRIFTGNFPGSDFHLQRLLDAVAAENSSESRVLLDRCLNLLRLSEYVAARCNLNSNEYTAGEIWREEWSFSLPQLVEQGKAAIFSESELEALGIATIQLQPFVLTHPEGLLEQPFGANEIMARPLIWIEGRLMLPIPALVSPAIRLHLAQMIEQRYVSKSRVTDHLQTYLLGRWLSYDFPLRGHRPLDNQRAKLAEPTFELFGDYAHSVIRFDEDKFAHLIVLSADWSRTPEFELHGVVDSPNLFSAHLTSYIRSSVAGLSARLGSDRGLTLVVYDSPGWNVDFYVSVKPTIDWFVAGLSSSDLSMLLSDPDFDLLALWKILRQKRQLEDRGLHLGFWPDLLNYWSFSRELGGTLWPAGIDLDSFGGLTGDTGAIQPWAAQARRMCAAHGALAANGEWERVERHIDSDAPLIERSKPIYLQPLALVTSELRNVVETPNSSWWISIARPPFSPEEKQYLYLLWQTVTEWACKLAEAQSYPLGPAKKVLELRLLPVPDAITDAQNGFEFQRADQWPVVTVVIPPTFTERLATPDNEGEVALVRAIVKAAAMATDSPVSDEHCSTWVAEVTADPSLKMMHVTYSPDIGLAIDATADRARLRLLQTGDILNENRHIRAMLSDDFTATDAGEDGALIDKDRILRCLNAVVDVRWKRCRERLHGLNRIDTLVLISRLIESIHRDRVIGERAALARTRLYASSPDFGAWTIQSIAERDMAFRAYRVLAEMAVCECPIVGGRSTGLSDIDAIAADIFLLINNAEYSDAVKNDLVPGKLVFLADGTLQQDSADARVIMPDYLRASLQEVSQGDIDAYPELYVSSHAEAAPEGDQLLLDAFSAEFGITLVHAAEICLALQELALSEQNYVICLRKSRLLERLAELGKPVSSPLLDSFLLAFGLSHRPSWDTAPAPFKSDDIWPWLFERRLSLMLRPVLIAGEGSDPLVIYGVRQLEMGIHYVAHLLEDGIWPKAKLVSSQARTWVDAAIAARGFGFEQEIANLVAGSGWQTITSIGMKTLGAPKTMGEIDILAVSPDAGKWLLLECKWFGAVRTAREVANWMQDYHGKGGDKLDRHLRRYEWIAANLATVADRLKLSVPNQLMGRIVTTRPVPLAFTKRLPEPATVLTRREIPNALGSLTTDQLSC